VADDRLEELVAQMGGTRNSAKPTVAAVRRQSDPALRQQSVRFSDAIPEDALDREMRQTTVHLQRSPARRRGSWKVSDEQIEELVHKTMEANSAESGTGRTLAHAGKMMSSAKSDPSLKYSPLTMSETHMLKFSACQQSPPCRKGLRKIVASTQPQWDCTSPPKLFAHVGSGLDGKGNKTIKPEVVPFEANPIYMSDARDARFSRVRQAVTGHSQYMRR
jgi:hypothetical protein